MNNYNNAFTEVYTILNYLDEEEYNKIPPEVINAITSNMNKKYNYAMNEKIDLSKQPMLDETRAILFNLFRDYLATAEQKEKIIKMQNEERQKNELRKQEQYDTNVFANKERNKTKTKENLADSENEKMQIVEYKENIFKRIFNKIKSFFTKK